MTTIGIDLGTTNSLVAYWKEKEAIIIPNILNKNMTPSVVSIDENDEILVGEIAKERLITHPECTVSNFKRFMGTSKTFNMGKYNFTPEELASFVLKSLKSDAENFLDEEITEAVISVPAYFNDAQRKATKRAGELAGLKVERLVSEPTAAAIAYGLNEKDGETQFLIFDLGGGTFDVSILELFDGVMEVKSIAGDNYLGGEDFNNLLVHYFIKKNNLNVEQLDRKVISALYKQGEICKITLTEKQSAKMELIIDEEPVSMEITRQEFEKISEELILKLRNPIERALNDADIDSEELDSIILVGGSTRMPLIRSIVTKMFNKIPYSTINPDEVVAKGAAIQAALKEKDEDLREMVLTDVCPYTLGVDVVSELGNGRYEDGYFLPIIERNSPIPISKVRTLYTVADNQRHMLVNIYQGERRRVADNIKLGEIEIEIPKGAAGEHPVDVRYTYDINGLLEVEVTIVSTGEVKSLVIENAPGSLSKEEIEERLKMLSSLKIHPREKTENRLLVARGERLYEESLGSKRVYISQLLQGFERVLETQDSKLIEEASKNLTEEFNKLEENC
ncbi:molecular chaperone HscC [Clostridium bornimense]|uniref:Hsp70 family protein n=1 Tax=Clostridium bornimense TaxID=1216932 RepID=UPI001C10F2C2|nr:molecular chaperone HscC [Clostridium bornimense]MBU5317088.1 molecular chaperone HscC [Clostridium bornimense]